MVAVDDKPSLVKVEAWYQTHERKTRPGSMMTQALRRHTASLGLNGFMPVFSSLGLHVFGGLRITTFRLEQKVNIVQMTISDTFL